ncbi:hypothetical protein Taro_029689, partial [Colocasia esculenta]|nr:hypothetical protein [Colocasia esculenta]
TQASVGPKTSLISKLRRLAAIHCKWTQDIGCASDYVVYTNLSQVVSTQSTCVLTRSACVLTQSASRVDTLNGQIDTSPRFQKTQLPDWDSVSTLPVSVSTLDPVPRIPVLRKWNSVSTHSLVVSTQST